MAKYQKGSFITVPNQHVLLGMDPMAQAVFLWLCHHANQDGECFPSQSTIAREAGMGKTSVKKALAILEEACLIEKENRKNGTKNLTNLYQVIIGVVGREATQVGREATEGVGRHASRELKSSSLTKSTELPLAVARGVEIENLQETSVEKKNLSNFRDERRVESGRPPMTPRKSTDKQRTAMEIFKGGINYFKEMGYDQQGMMFMDVTNDQRNKQVRKQLATAYEILGGLDPLKGMIDWWFEGAGEFANYEPEACFTAKMIERYKNYLLKGDQKGGVKI